MADNFPQILLHCQDEHYGIKTNSFLHGYFKDSNLDTDNVCMNKILSLIKNHALNGKLFDVRNPAMIICDQLLENIFQVRALHITQVRGALAKSLVPKTVLSEEPCVTIYATQNRNNVVPMGVLNSGVGTISSTFAGSEVTMKYKLSEPLKELYRQSKILQHQQDLFTYREAAALLVQYIRKRRSHIIDWRNMEVCLLYKDPLGAVFNCEAFHKSQIKMYMRKQLLPVPVGYQTQSHNYQLRPRKK